MKNINKIFLSIFIFIFLFIIVKIIFFIIPYKELDTFLKKPYSVKVVDRNNLIIQILPLENGERREYIDNISFFSKEIFIKSEDKRFYYHFGIDLLALCRSIMVNIKNKKVISGASTISMQLSRMISPQKKNILGKLLEIINAIRIETKLNKKEILLLYLNSLPFGFNVRGVESGAKFFFGKSYNNLNPAEVLILSLIPRNPSKYNPLNKQNKGNILKTAKKIKENIKLNISDSDINNAIDNAKSYNYEYYAPHFVNYIKKFIKTSNKSIIKSSLDLSLNEFAQNRLKEYINKYSNKRLTNGAIIVFDNYTGEILVYIGSKDFFDKNNSGEIDGVQVYNQAGSTLKPFLYALAIEKYNFLPSDILPDIPSFFGGEEVYIPKNFNNRFNGPTRLRVALGSSLNIPAVYTVVKIGVKNFVSQLIDLDFESIKNSKKEYGSGIAVGNAEVSLFEIARAFSIFMRMGEKIKLTYLKEDKREFKHGEKIFSDYTYFIITDILSDVKARSVGFGITNLFNLPFQAIFKTGTSNQFNNIWAFGSTTDYTVGVWMGNFSGETVIGISGSELPAKLCIEILDILSKKRKPYKLPVPKDIVQEVICPLSGKKIGANCPGSVYEYFKKGTKIDECNWHILKEGKIKVVLPYIYNHYIDKIENIEIKFDIPLIKKNVKIVSPNDNSVYYYDPTYSKENQFIKFELFCKDKNEKVYIYVNNNLYKEIVYPFYFFFPMKKGEYNIKSKVKNDSDEIKIKIK